MCGIIGYIGEKRVLPILIDGLRRLEYRGYDSAGVAVVHDGTIELRRSAGKLARLEEAIAVNPLDGEYGINNLFVGVPVKLGEKGVEQVIEITLTLEERAALQKSAAAVKELTDIIGV